MKRIEAVAAALVSSRPRRPLGPGDDFASRADAVPHSPVADYVLRFVGLLQVREIRVREVYLQGLDRLL